MWNLICGIYSTYFDLTYFDMGWLRLVGCLKIYVSLQNIGLFCRALLQKRPIFLSILVIVATPYMLRVSRWCGMLPWIQGMGMYVWDAHMIHVMCEMHIWYMYVWDAHMMCEKHMWCVRCTCDTRVCEMRIWYWMSDVTCLYCFINCSFALL